MFSSLIAFFCSWCLQNDLAGHKVKHVSSHDALVRASRSTSQPIQQTQQHHWARFGTCPLEIPTEMAQNWRFNFPLFQCGCVWKWLVPLKPKWLMIIIPIKWLFHWEYTLFSDKPMSVSPCFASCRCCADSREYQERVQYHARRFASSKCYQEALQRYDLRRQRADNLELQRFTFHVASWVAELDAERMTQKCLAGSGWWFQRWACLKKRYPAW